MTKYTVSFLVFVLLIAVSPLEAGFSWRACERQGDRLFRAKKYQEALNHYIRAIVLGPKPSPKRLWNKHSHAYANTPAGIKEAQTMKRSGGQELPPWQKQVKFTETFVRKASYSPTEKVKTDELNTLATASRNGKTEAARIVAPEYEISQIAIHRRGTGRLKVTGRVTNTSEWTIHNPRVYITLYDQIGNLRGRVWGYLKGGRNTLERGDDKNFEVKFMGFRGTVGYYKAELVARFKQEGRG